jgi:dynein heavy chain
VATRPNVLDDLHRIDSQLQLCEKALAQYLESKRVDFPRFYFVSTADLLDILSNGNSPQLIQRHLTKLFDAVARIKLEPITNNQKDGKMIFQEF